MAGSQEKLKCGLVGLKPSKPSKASSPAAPESRPRRSPRNRIVYDISSSSSNDTDDDSDSESDTPTECPMPLISVDVNASIVHAVAQVEVTQVYVNKEEQPIEAIYYFPVNPDGAVTHFQAELEGRVIKGTVKAHEEAKKEYEKAVENQTTALLGEETKADIFKVLQQYKE
ncbi:Poly [ADP-ribose] polymerase 4 [Orchesella cincta]|uniref:Poly [ADP-ribose] polymerase 4 n=1 Tax=Orchesella cincta TaxID=48709 RepID=A0A1D2NFL1_ORCCI|nr:Poly [ADP-ribose] polymerase 4 [Orchesella cincta]